MTRVYDPVAEAHLFFAWQGRWATGFGVQRYRGIDRIWILGTCWRKR